MRLVPQAWGWFPKHIPTLIFQVVPEEAEDMLRGIGVIFLGGGFDGQEPQESFFTEKMQESRRVAMFNPIYMNQEHRPVAMVYPTDIPNRYEI